MAGPIACRRCDARNVTYPCRCCGYAPPMSAVDRAVEAWRTYPQYGDKLRMQTALEASGLLALRDAAETMATPGWHDESCELEPGRKRCGCRRRKEQAFYAAVEACREEADRG